MYVVALCEFGMDMRVTYKCFFLEEPRNILTVIHIFTISNLTDLESIKFDRITNNDYLTKFG